MVLIIVAIAVALALTAAPVHGQVVDSVSVTLQQNQYDLSTDGLSFLRKEAANASFFMLGELHGENEIPALIRGLWPAMWQAGYRHIAAEVSPWSAHRLEFGPHDVPVLGLWNQTEATFVTSLKSGGASVLWGCDIEEVQPHLPLRELASANPEDTNLRAAVEMTRSGYQRRMAPALLQLVRASSGINDRSINGVSLRSSLLETLEVESDRLAGSALKASTRRETVLKQRFHEDWLRAGKPKVFLRFGRNHLHRGYDRRGVSTLGNFVAELASAEQLYAFNVAAFAGGGTIRLLGPASDADERNDDPAFAFLASSARFPATVFDLRPVRQALHRIAENKRSATESSLVYWADSYDAIIYYRQVTPLGN